MEYNNVKLAMSIMLIIIGIIYFLIPRKTIKAIHFMNSDFNPAPKLVTKYKYGGLIIFILGSYYLLAELGFVAMFTF